MKKKILAFAGSNHSQSIHHELVKYTASVVTTHEVNVLDLRDWVIPIYSIDMDPDQTPPEIAQLIQLIQQADGFIIASPEHNGSTPAFLKNIIDWMSRREKQVFGQKPVLLMSTSPGGRGGASNLAHLTKTLPYQGAQVVASFALPSYFDHFQDGKLSEAHQTQLQN
ncbi:MAG: NADPH-dependent FMN reductase, partial [Bacteroidota bacterium]